jgi:lipoprotein-anchoring transpeptidase ErfK/SrfK
VLLSTSGLLAAVIVASVALTFHSTHTDAALADASNATNATQMATVAPSNSVSSNTTGASSSNATESTTNASGSTTQKPASSSSATPSKPKVVDWTKPTGGPYPVLHKGESVWIDVSIGKQRLYVKSGNKTLYTMIVSSGIQSDPSRRTPLGVFHIQAERGTWFYAPRFQEGAEYWVSFLNHGEYLFHSVPMNANKQVLTADAKRLGQQDSHGCIHLSIPDAKWFYYHIPEGTKVVIQA